ncbi:MAG: TIGR03000 domain-containing protein [Planctomycetes bacterium]|nr:TIGR03000 domain-containing protein [Planctomycetota bacterium]
MNLRRLIAGLCLSVGFVLSVGVADAQFLARRRAVVYATPAANYGYSAPALNYGYGTPMATYWWPAPYVLPLPAYGILPPPLATYNMLYGDSYATNGAGYGNTQTYGGVIDPTIPPARKRSALYPAVPFGTTGGEIVVDRRRVRYEIGVPKDNAVLLIDGVKTKQTGRKRVFVTPALEEDKQYTVTISVQWLDENGDKRIRERTFTVVAGETVRHTFVE